MEEDSDVQLRAKFVQVLAKAASNKEYLEKLKADTDKTLEEEGITGGGFFIQVANDATLKEILRIYDELGGVICKRR